ncbi:hypothetical protein JTB14_010085 [Gonioctena quinquepunctata]|nr:hypothetical protein JTB14_010085 [Gonioctena quinquepunctata]
MNVEGCCKCTKLGKPVSEEDRMSTLAFYKEVLTDENVEEEQLVIYEGKRNEEESDTSDELPKEKLGKTLVESQKNGIQDK